MGQAQNQAAPDQDLDQVLGVAQIDVDRGQQQGRGRQRSTTVGTRATSSSHRRFHAGSTLLSTTMKMRHHAGSGRTGTHRPSRWPPARISRGNDTFLTRPALLTTTPVAVITPVWKKFQQQQAPRRGR